MPLYERSTACVTAFRAAAIGRGTRHQSFIRLCRVALATVMVGVTLTLYVPSLWVALGRTLLRPGDQVHVHGIDRWEWAKSEIWTIESIDGDRVRVRGSGGFVLDVAASAVEKL